MYYFVERSIVVIKPKQAFVDWVITTFDDLEGHLNLENMRIDCNSYLIPEIDEIEDGIKFVDEKYDDLFRMELSSWTADENLWPQNISLKIFWEWFDVEISPSLIDLSNDDEDEEEPADTIH